MKGGFLGCHRPLTIPELGISIPEMNSEGMVAATETTPEVYPRHKEDTKGIRKLNRTTDCLNY